jgi:hypothetical protein
MRWRGADAVCQPASSGLQDGLFLMRIFQPIERLVFGWNRVHS